jgi:hypothetical protein
MWIDLLLVLIAVLPLFSRNKTRTTNAAKFPAVIANQTPIPPSVRL